MLSYGNFCKMLVEKYNTIADMFWMEQYALYQQGVRDVRLHDTTLVELGNS